MADKKTTDTDLTKDAYAQQMQSTIANQQKQIDILSQQMYPSRGSNLTSENTNIIPLNQYSTPVVDGGISGRDYYSATPMSFVAPNIESRQRAAASNLRDYQTVEYFKDNFDSLIGSIKNIPGINDDVYNNLVNNAYGAINELADKKDLENYNRYIKELANKIGGDWGGNALNQSHTDYTAKRKDIQDKSEAFDATKTGGYSPEMREYANNVLNEQFKGVKFNEETGKVEYNNFQMPNLIEYQNVTKQVEDLISGWKEDGTLTTDASGNIKWIRDIPGSMGMVSRDSVSESDLRNYALKYLESAGLGTYMEQQATIKTTNALNSLSARQANGANIEEDLERLVNNYEKNYSNPLEYTGAVIKRLKENKSKGVSYADSLLANGAIGFKELMRGKFEDDTIGLPASKHSYTKDSFNSYTDHQAQKDIDFAYEQRLQNAGLGKYYDDGTGSGSSSSGSSGNGADFSEGAETFAISIHRDGFMFNDSYTVPNLVKYKEEADNAYTKANNDLIDLRRRAANGDKGVSTENLENADRALKQADDEVRYYKETMENVSNNTMSVLKSKGFNLDTQYSNFAKYTDRINKANSKHGIGKKNFPSKAKFKTMITELTGLVVNGNYSKLYRTSEYLDLLDKYKINPKDSEELGTLVPYVDSLAKDIGNITKSMKGNDRDKLLSPQLDATYLISEGSNAKNTALKSYESNLDLISKTFKNSPKTFRALNSKGEANDFIKSTSSYFGVPEEEVFDLIDWENTNINPLINKDYILSKKVGHTGVQYMATIALKSSGETFKKYKSKLEDVRKNGNLKILVTPDKVNAEASNKAMNKHYQELFNDVATRGLSAHSVDVINAVGLGWANTNGYSKDFNKYTFYDLSPDNPERNLREVDVNGFKYGVRAIYSDAINKGVTDKDFYVSRKDPNRKDTGYYNQILVKENATGTIKWVGVEEINKAGGNSKSKSQYSRIIANTPQDLLGYLATSDLYEGMYRQQLSNPKKANGGSLRGASSYNMNPEYRGVASKIRQVESSNNYGLKGDIAWGAYQVVPGAGHRTKIKNLYGMSMEQYLASPETQDKYFETLANGYRKFLSGSKGIRLLNIIKTVNPRATFDDAMGVVHFWGEGNVDNLLNGKYSIDTKIPYTKNGVTKYNPTLRYHVQKLSKG